MSRRTRARRLLVAGLAGVLVLVSPLSADAAVVQGLVSVADAVRGLGWAAHPDQTAGGTERFVEGPLTPPSGRGSLEMTAADPADRALIFTVPKPSDGVPPGDIAAFIATPWASTSGSFSTFTTNTTSTADVLPVLKLVGYQVFNTANPALSTGFTTLNFEAVYQTPAPAANTWQTWTLNSDARVWQSNSADGICGQATQCTMTEFANQYPQGAWGQIQVGIGTGAPAGSTGYVDLVQVSDGTTTFVADYEPAAASTATITAGAATATGGSVSITLNASELAALGSTEFTITFSGTSATSPAPVTVPAGQTATQSFTLPFGTTSVTVQAQGATIASAPVTFQSAGAAGTANSAQAGSELPATGPPSGHAQALAMALVLIGFGLGAIGLAQVLPRRRTRDA